MKQIYFLQVDTNDGLDCIKKTYHLLICTKWKKLRK